MLKDFLKKKNDPRFHAVHALWTGESNIMSVEQCLAMRIDLLQSRGFYSKQYQYFVQNNIHVLSPPSAVESVEAAFLPNSVSFDIINDRDVCVKSYKASEEKDAQFINIMTHFSSDLPELPKPNCAGVRFHYPAAVAQTISELKPDIVRGLSDHNIDMLTADLSFITTIKDGGDGMGEVSIHKEKSDQMLPDKAFRFSFAVVKVEAVTQGEKYVVYENTKPNSVRTNRPLLEALADENNKVSNIVCTTPIEIERTFISDHRMKIFYENDYFQLHNIKFFNSMIDEKRDRSDAGLQGAGSKYLCTLCYADRDTCKSHLGSFEIS